MQRLPNQPPAVDLRFAVRLSEVPPEERPAEALDRDHRSATPARNGVPPDGIGPESDDGDKANMSGIRVLARVLCFLSEPDLADAVRASLRSSGFLIEVVSDGPSGFALLAGEDHGGFDVALIDSRLPDMADLALLSRLAQERPSLASIVLLDGTMIPLAGEALDSGAEHCISLDESGRFLDLLPALLCRTFQRQRLIAEHERAIAALTRSEARFRSLIETSSAGIVLIGRHGTIRFANSAFSEMLGCHVADIAGTSYFDLVDPEHLEDVRHRFATLAEDGEIFGCTEEWRYRRRDGDCVWGAVNVAWTPDDSSQDTPYIVVVQDITALRQAEAALTRERNFVDAVLDSEAALLLVLDREGCVIRWNRACSELTGYSFAEVRGKRVFDFLLTQEDSKTMRAWFDDPTGTSVPPQHESIILQKDGTVRIVDWSNSVLHTPAGQTNYVVASGIDITERKRAEAVIRHQANYDALTGLPNRSLFLDRLSQAISATKRSGTLLAVMFIDLDRFKSVNDTLGHRAGDQLLAEAARRLETCLRSSDTVARLGGDEFTVVVSNLSDPTDIETVARKILRELAIPYSLDGREEFITCSIGITIYPDDADSVEGLLRNADIAMYRAKDAGRNGFVLFQPEMNANAVKRRELERQLRQTLDESGFALHYQPIVASTTGRTVGVEALLRWPHPEYGMVPPDVFIPIAEETGLIIPLGEWVLRTACAQARRWDAQGLTGLGVSVNVSAMQCQQFDYPRLVKEVLSETGLSADRLTIEITESLMLNDERQANHRLHALREIGVHLSVDDFGTGYSSLSYLKRLPIDGLKIDRSFIMDITTDADDAVVVDAIIALAKSFGIHVVAEGVETAEQLHFLQSRECAFAQGYLFSRPVPPETLAAAIGASDPPGPRPKVRLAAQ